MDYASLNDVYVLFRPLSSDESARAEALIPIVCDTIRMEASKVGQDFDARMCTEPWLPNVARITVVDIVARSLMTPTSGTPMSQVSEAGLGYSVSGTFLNPGGGLFVKRDELKRLGIRRQRIGVIDLWKRD